MSAILLAFLATCNMQENPAPNGLQPVPLEWMNGGVLAELEGELTRLHQRLRPSLLAVHFPIQISKGAASHISSKISFSGVLLDHRGYFVSPLVPVAAGPPTVTTLDGRTRKAKLIAKGTRCGLALFQAPDLGLKPAPMGCSRRLGVGSFMLILGNPFGLGASLDLGLLSGLNRTLDSSTGLIQITGSVNPGDGGGLVADRRGRIVGVLRTSLREAGSPEANSESQELARAERIGFAIPIEEVLADFSVPLGLNRSSQPRLGMVVNYHSGEKDSGRLLVETILPNTQAEKLGLLAGDRILKINGRSLPDLASLRDAVASCSGSCVMLVQRDGSPLRLEFSLPSCPSLISR